MTNYNTMIRTSQNINFLRETRRSFTILLFCMIYFLAHANPSYNTNLYYFGNNLETGLPNAEENVEVETSNTSTETTYVTLDKTTGISEAVYSASEYAMMPTISLNSLCDCRDNGAGQNGNATTLDNGQYEDIIEVESLTGENWIVVSSSSAFDTSSPQPPLSPINIIPGTNLIETSVGSGMYQIPVIYTESTIYSITVTNGIDELTATNLLSVCSYPEPSFVDLRSGYCTITPSFPLQVDNDGLVGVGTFTILDATTLVEIVADAVDFDANMLGAGSYIVQYSFTETGGCTQSIEQTVDIVNPFMSLFCNNNLNVSLDANCEVLVTPDMILEGTFESYGIFDIEITAGLDAVSNPISADYEGEILTTKIINSCTGNSCWGSIIVEDKNAPVFDCPVNPIIINCAANLNDIVAPTAVDNCDGVIPPSLIDETIINYACDDANGLIRSIAREYTALDSKGNQTEVNCIQIIEVPRGDLINITFPGDLTYECGTNPNTNPIATGYPMYDGVPLNSQGICNFVSYPTDDTLSICATGYKIVRTWTVIDWCNASSTPTSTVSEEQIIKVIDTTAPTLTCPASIDIDINELDCTATFFLPNIDISDECSNYTTQIFTPLGNITDIENEALSGLSIGIHEVNYTVTDDCGNFDNCIVQINIQDTTAPTMVCDEITQVTLDAEGIAIVNAIDLDDGSFDHCTSLEFGIRRMDGDGTYSESAYFDCNDAQAPVMVEVQGTDLFGTTNSCMVEVLVDDNSLPIMTCPDNVTIECGQDYETYFGFPSIIETCSVMPLNFTTSVNINSCDEGDATRIFTISDINGNTASCEQTVTVINDDFLTLADITFPTNPTPFECGTTVESLAIDSLPVESQYPIINAPPCAQIATSHEDIFLDISEPACLRIMRTWTVVDWCQFDPADPDSDGIFVHTQQIDVIDNEAPILICPPNPFVKIINPVCDTTIFLFGPDTLMDCNPNVFLTATSVLGEGLGPFEDVPIGLYDITLIADDGCGNVSYCDYILSVQDNKPPTPYCVGSLIIGLMETGAIEVNIEDFNAGSFDNCTAPEDLLFSYSVNPFDSLMTFTCNDVGDNMVGMYVTDESFNTDYCMVNLIVQDNMLVCGAPLIVSGAILTEGLSPVSEVMFGVNGIEEADGTTESGTYSLALEEGEDYTVLPNKNTNHSNGISTYDIVLIKQHILGTQSLGSPYKIIAADANHSGSVTTADVLALKRLILTLDTEFQNNTSWRFVEASYEFPNPANPFEFGFPEFWSVNNLDESQENIDFVAIKVGDVNGNSNGLGFTDAGEERTDNNLIFEIENKVITKGETETIWLTNNELENLLGFQGTISFDANILDFIEIKEGSSISISDFNLSKVSEGNLSLSWENASLLANELRFGITFRAKQTTAWSDVLSFTNDAIASEAYKVSNGGVDFSGIELSFEETNFNDFVLHQNTPNPFNKSTIISFELPKTSAIQLSIYDISGRLLWTKEENFERGFNQVEVEKNDLNGSGVLFYKLEAADFVATKRMMLL